MNAERATDARATAVKLENSGDPLRDRGGIFKLGKRPTSCRILNELDEGSRFFSDPLNENRARVLRIPPRPFEQVRNRYLF